MKSTIVKTRQELEAAQKNKFDKIMIVGDLAEQVKKAEKVGMAGKTTIAILLSTLGIAAVTAPITGGLSFALAAPAAALTGMEIAAIIAASAIGIRLVASIFEDYKTVTAGFNEYGPYVVIEKK